MDSVDHRLELSVRPMVNLTSNPDRKNEQVLQYDGVDVFVANKILWSRSPKLDELVVRLNQEIHSFHKHLLAMSRRDRSHRWLPSRTFIRHDPHPAKNFTHHHG